MKHSDALIIPSRLLCAFMIEVGLEVLLIAIPIFCSRIVMFDILEMARGRCKALTMHSVVVGSSVQCFQMVSRSEY